MLNASQLDHRGDAASPDFGLAVVAGRFLPRTEFGPAGGTAWGGCPAARLGSAVAGDVGALDLSGTATRPRPDALQLVAGRGRSPSVAVHGEVGPGWGAAHGAGVAGSTGPRDAAAAPATAVAGRSSGQPGGNRAPADLPDLPRFSCPGEIALPRLDGERLPVATPPSISATIRRGFSGWHAIVKRVSDVVGAAVLLVVVLPLLVAVAAALQFDSPGPVLFVQQRVGRGGRLFGCLKLRTMRVDADRHLAALLASCPRARREWAADHKLRNDPRVSPAGRLVRKLSLDELPQLMNVLLGQMSMVGPRPIVAAEAARYGAFYADYCAVKPGLTGLWQISGRNDVSYGERVQFDRHYVRHASFWLDLRIALRTVPAVLFASGSY